MQSVGLFEAWGLWWQGKSVQGMSLWGILPVLVIGRLGKVMAFIGSVVAVIDIVGPDNIRQWADRIRRSGDEASLNVRFSSKPEYLIRFSWVAIPISIVLAYVVLNYLPPLEDTGVEVVDFIIKIVSLVLIVGIVAPLVAWTFLGVPPARGRPARTRRRCGRRTRSPSGACRRGRAPRGAV